MVRAKNYATMSKFAQVIRRILWWLLFFRGHGVQLWIITLRRCVAGMAIYLGYGVWHSNERRTDDKQVADKDTVIIDDADADKASQQQTKN